MNGMELSQSNHIITPSNKGEAVEIHAVRDLETIGRIQLTWNLGFIRLATVEAFTAEAITT